MLILIWIINFAISWWNAYVVGTVWDACKRLDSLWMRLVVWSAAIMSACGFTWCYSVILALLGSALPMTLIDKHAEAGVPILDASRLDAFLSLGYLVIIGPVLAAGMVILVQTWLQFLNTKRQRSIGDYALTGWNTYAQIDNTISAVRTIPGALDRVRSLFKKSDDAKSSTIVVVLVLMAVFGGVLTTYNIVQYRRRSVGEEGLFRMLTGE